MTMHPGAVGWRSLVVRPPAYQGGALRLAQRARLLEQRYGGQ